MTLAERIAALDTRYDVAEQVADDQLGNKRIVRLAKLEHDPERKVIKVRWKVHTVNGNGEDITGKNVLNPYEFTQTANDGHARRIDPAIGDKVQHQESDYSSTSDADLKTELDNRSIPYDADVTTDELVRLLKQDDYDQFISNTVSEYSYFVSLVKGNQARYYDVVRAQIVEAAAEGRV